MKRVMAVIRKIRRQNQRARRSDRGFFLGLDFTKRQKRRVALFGPCQTAQINVIRRSE